MRALQSILLATDFRPASRATEEAVIGLASTVGASVTLLHVLNPLLTWPAKMPEIRALADRLLGAIANRLTSYDVKVDDVLLATGQQSDTINRKALEIEADLIAIGAGEELERGYFKTGPMAEAIIQHAQRPVLAVRPGEPALAFRSILCPVDHSAASKRGLQNAISLAQLCESQLHVLTVVPSVSWVYSALETGKLLGGVAEHENRWRQEFDTFLQDNDFAGVFWKKETRNGIPHEEIVKAVQELNADLIVMGCTGRSGLAHILMGSTTRRILRRLPCSLLTVKEESALEDLFDEDIRTINLLFAEGKELLQSKVYSAARDKFHHLLQRNPYHVPALEGYAEACAKLQRNQEAEIYRHRAEMVRQQRWSS